MRDVVVMKQYSRLLKRDVPDFLLEWMLHFDLIRSFLPQHCLECASADLCILCKSHLALFLKDLILFNFSALFELVLFPVFSSNLC